MFYLLPIGCQNLQDSTQNGEYLSLLCLLSFTRRNVTRIILCFSFCDEFRGPNCGAVHVRSTTVRLFFSFRRRDTLLLAVLQRLEASSLTLKRARDEPRESCFRNWFASDTRCFQPATEDGFRVGEPGSSRPTDFPFFLSPVSIPRHCARGNATARLNVALQRPGHREI